MSFVLDGARLAVPGEDAIEVTVEQWRQIVRSGMIVIDGQEITADDGPFRIVKSPEGSVERIADSLMGSPLAGDIPVDPPVSVDVMTRDPMDSKTADAAYIYVSLASSPALMDLQKSVLEELDGLGAAYDAQKPEHFHITLLYLFKVDNRQLQELIEAITFPAAFTVDGVRIGTFREADDKPVALMVNPDNALLRIQRELYERALSMGLEISPFSRPQHYKPHVTLAYDLQPPDQKLPRMDAPVRLTVDSIAITRPDYRMARAIRLPQVPGGAAFITRRGIPTAGFFERQERQEQTAVARAIGEVRRRLGDFVESLTGRHLGPGDHPSGSPQTVHAGDGAGGSSDHLGQHNERIRSFREKYNGLINEGEELLESMVERGDAERADDLYYDNGIHRLFVSPDGSIYRVDDHGTVAERVLKGHADELGIEEHGDYVDTFIRLGFARGHAQDYEEGEQGALNVEVTTPVPEAQRRSIRDMVEAGQASGVEISLDANTSESGRLFETEEEIDAVIWTAGDGAFRSIDDFFGVIERHMGPGDHPSGSPQTVHAGNGADGAENELWGREHHRPVVLELEPEAESLVELRETIADWPNDARWIAESLLESTQSPERVMEDPVLYEEAKKRYLHEETERMVEEIYDDADSFADLPVPEDEMVAMGNDEIESEIRDIARERVEASFDDSHFFDWMEQDVIDMGGIYSTEDITIGLARDQETDEIVGAFSLRQAYGFEMREPYRIVESMESPETEEAHLALADEWEGQNYLSLDWLASGESGNGYGSTMMGHIFEIASLEDAGIIGEPTGAAIPFYERFDAVIHDFGNRRILWSPEDVDDLASQFQQEAKAADFDIPTRAEPEDDLEPKNGAYARRPTDGAGVALYDWRAKLGLRPLRERAEESDDPDDMGPSPDREIGTVATGGAGRSGFALLKLPPPQPNSIVSLGYTPMTLEWGHFADGAFDFMRLREEALRERHKGPGDHPSGSPQQVHAGDDAAAGDESGDGSAGEDGEPVAGEEGMEDADEFEVEDDGPERREPFRKALDDVGDATIADPATYWSDVYEDVKALHQEAYRLEEEGRRDEAIELRRQIKKKLVFDSLAFAEQTEAWRDTTEEEFAGAFPQVEGVGFDEDAPHEYDAMRMMGNARETAWRVSLERAIHRGDVPYDKEVLEARGYYENSDRWVPLEGRDLYHVTTAASAVLDSGLKSRFELSMDHGVGLGGGPDDTISFTADRETARAIELSLHEARMVARNDITARDLVEAAAEGRGAEEPFVDNVLGSLEPGYEPGDYEAGDGLSKVDPRTRERFDGRVVDSIMLGSTLEEYRARNGSEWEPYTEGRYEPIESTTGGTRYRAFVRSMTESEQREFRFRVYKTYSTWRQQAGGRMDPLFFASDPQALAEVDASEIRTMRYEPRPNSMGMQAGALGEIRTPSTEGLEFVEDIEFVESEDDDILAERHLGPGDHPSGSPQEVHAGGSGKLQRLAEKVSGDFRSYDDVLDMFSYWQEFMRQELGRDIVRVGIGEFERTGTKGTVIEDEDGNRLEVQIGGFGGDQEVTLTWIRANNKGTGLGTAFMEAIKSTVDLKGQKFRVAFVSNPDFYSRFDWLAQEEQAGFWEGRGNFTYDPR